MQKNLVNFTTIVGITLLSFLPKAIAHGHDDTMNPNLDGAAHTSAAASLPTSIGATESLDSYFQYGEHSGFMFAHIVLMTLGWVFLLPVGK